VKTVFETTISANAKNGGLVTMYAHSVNGQFSIMVMNTSSFEVRQFAFEDAHLAYKYFRKQIGNRKVKTRVYYKRFMNALYHSTFRLSPEAIEAMTGGE